MSNHSGVLHGAQLWVALPHASTGVPAAFSQHADLPVLDSPGAAATVIMGELAGVASPAQTYSPLLGVEIALGADFSPSSR